LSDDLFAAVTVADEKTKAKCSELCVAKAADCQSALFTTEGTTCMGGATPGFGKFEVPNADTGYSCANVVPAGAI